MADSSESMRPNFPKAFTILDFGLRFELIREKPEKKEKDALENTRTKLGRPKGIKFDRDGNICELYSTDDTAMIHWRNFLR